METHPLTPIRALLRISLAFAALGIALSAQAETAERIEMSLSGSGTLYVTASASGIEAEFLLDTGAGMVTLNKATFDAISAASAVRRVRQIGARLANNRVRLMDVYELEQFSIGGCELGPLEVAVMKGSGRNLLGLSALAPAAPFSIALSPPALSVSRCRQPEGLASLSPPPAL